MSGKDGLNPVNTDRAGDNTQTSEHDQHQAALAIVSNTDPDTARHIIRILALDQPAQPEPAPVYNGPGIG